MPDLAMDDRFSSHTSQAKTFIGAALSRYQPFQAVAKS